MKHKTLLMKQIIQKPHDIKTYAEQAEIYSWFLYRSAPAYQNEEFRFLIQPAAKQNKYHRISFQIGCFSSNIKMFLAFHIVQTMLNIKPPQTDLSNLQCFSCRRPSHWHWRLSRPYGITQLKPRQATILFHSF